MNSSLPLEKELGGIFTKFPALPDNIKEILVKIAPFLCILGVVLGGLALLAVLGIGAGIGAIGATAYGSTTGYYISMAFLALGVILEAMAIQPLLKRQKNGWNLMYYVFLINTVGGIIGLVLGYGGIFGPILGFVIGGWILFQVRDKYA